MVTFVGVCSKQTCFLTKNRFLAQGISAELQCLIVVPFFSYILPLLKKVPCHLDIALAISISLQFNCAAQLAKTHLLNLLLILKWVHQII